MATAAIEPSELECPVCHEHFTTPKILPCAHLLCRHCLVMWLCSEPEAQCPLCRAPIAPAEGNGVSRKANDIADGLPTDVAMEALVECAAILRKDHVCCGCRKSSASSVCLNCSDMLCGSCSVIHRNMSTGRHHEVEDLHTITAERLSTVRRPSCSVHADRPSELFCSAHGVVICQLCATSKHRACPEVTELEEQRQVARGVLSDLAATLKTGERKMETAIRELDQFLLDSEKATQASLADIDQLCERLKRSVEAWCGHLKELALEGDSQTKDTVGQAKDCLLDRQCKMKSHHRLVERVGETMPRTYGVGDSTSALQTRVRDLDTSVVLPKGFKDITRVRLVIEQKAIERVERELSELSDLGHVTRFKVPLLVQPVPWSFHGNHEANIVLSDDQQSAERVKGDITTAVFSSNPMEVDMIYEVEVEEKCQGEARHFLPCGILEDDPAKVSFRQKLIDSKVARVIGEKAVWDRGIKTNKKVGAALRDLQAGSRVGVLVDSNNLLHLYVDGQHQGVAVKNVHRPCYALFSPSYNYRKITTCSLRVAT